MVVEDVEETKRGIEERGTRLSYLIKQVVDLHGHIYL